MRIFWTCKCPFLSQPCASLQDAHTTGPLFTACPQQLLNRYRIRRAKPHVGMTEGKTPETLHRDSWHQMRNISRLFLLIEGCLGTTMKIFCSSMFWLSSGWEISGGQTSWVLSFCKRMPSSQCYSILLT